MSNKELIANFMGLEFVTVGYTGGTDETEWQKENIDWFHSHHDFHDNSVGDYAVSIKRNIIKWQSDLNYDTNWNDLMLVVTKIKRIYSNSYGDDGLASACNKVVSLPITASINVVHRAVVIFIKWYNQNR